MSAEQCPSPSVLAAFHNGELPAAAIDRVAAHLERCATCEAELERLECHATIALAAALRSPRTRGGPPTAEAPGAVVAGRYLLLEPVGQGGMGSVWRARQTEPVRREVAVKLIKCGMHSGEVAARFEVERQALALMDHPNIAKVFDAGATADGRPFFVMEFVAGVPITRYCADHRVPPRQRLELFVQVCQAVQHAHTKGIIHRDIKPSNVLVALCDGRPVPKVIDFGVAKTVGGGLAAAAVETAVGSLVGTPQYMSPEQAALEGTDIDTRSDVYSLGVLLYELLTGAPPFADRQPGAGGLTEFLRTVREVDAPRPSTRVLGQTGTGSCGGAPPHELAALLRSELDWIVLRALEKDRARRYETASQFAADVQRYLAGEEVEAHPPSAAYRLKKFLYRNRRAAVTVALVAVALVVGTVGTALGLLAARRAEAAEAARADSEKRAKEDAQAAAAAASAATVRAERARDRAAAVLDAMTSTMTGEALASQATLSPEQKQFLSEALSHYRELVGEEAGDEAGRARAAAAAFRVGQIQARLSRLDEGLAACRLARERFAALVSDFPGVPLYRKRLVQCQLTTGATQSTLRRWSEAEQSLLAARADAERLAADFPAEPDGPACLAECRGLLSEVYARTGRPREAECELRAGLQVLERAAAAHPGATRLRVERARTLVSRGGLLIQLGDHAAAQEPVRQAADETRRLAAEYPAEAQLRQYLGAALGNLGRLHALQGGEAAAETCYNEARLVCEKLVADFPGVLVYHIDLAGCCCSFGGLLIHSKRPADGLPWFDRAIAALSPLHQTDARAREYLRNSYCGRAKAHELLGRTAAAVENWERAVELSPPEDPAAARTARLGLAGGLCNHGHAVRNGGRAADSVKWFDRAIEALTAIRASDPNDATAAVFLGNSHLGRAMAHDRLGRAGPALKDWDQAVRLSPPGERAERRAGRAGALLRARHWADAVAETVELSELPGWSGEYELLFAQICSLASTQVPDRRDEFAGRAVEFLRRAVKAGLKNPKALRESSELVPLRGFEGYKRLLSELDAAEKNN